MTQRVVDLLKSIKVDMENHQRCHWHAPRARKRFCETLRFHAIWQTRQSS